jgi:ABC-type transport system involved in multi-copper enzyme maturation permease subunit
MKLVADVGNSCGRITAIALNLFRETLREQVFYLSLLYTAILLSALVALPQFSYDSSEKMILDVGIAGIELIALITAVFVAANLLNKEIEKRTIFVLVAKPLSRAELLIGKHLGISFVIGLLVVIMTIIYLGLLKFRNIPAPSLAISVASFFIFWQIMLVSAIAILFGSFTSSLVSSLLTLVSYLVGNFSKDLLQLGEISKSESVQAVTRTLYLLLPDLSRANLKNEAVYGILPSVGELFSNGIYIFSYSLLVLAVAILIFGKRQL